MLTIDKDDPPDPRYPRDPIVYDQGRLRSRLRSGPYFSLGDKVRFREDSLLMVKARVQEGSVGQIVGTEERDGIRRVNVIFGDLAMNRIFSSELEPC